MVNHSENQQAMIKQYQYQCRTSLVFRSAGRMTQAQSYLRQLCVLDTQVYSPRSFQVCCTALQYDEDDNSEILLYKKIHRIFNELHVQLDPAGQIDRVLNQQEINRRWFLLRKKLLESYTGEAITHYFTAMDQLLQEPKLFLAYLNSYKMLGMLFNGLVQNSQHAVEQRMLGGIPEHMQFSKQADGLIAHVEIADDHQSAFTTYQGEFLFDATDILVDARLWKDDGDMQLTHSILRIG